MIPVQGMAQLFYRTRYKTAIFVETFAVSPILSLNMDHSVNRKKRSFTTIRYGLGFVPGGKKASGFGWSDNGVSLPVSITENLLMNNLKRRIKHRVALRCITAPPKMSVEWFTEVGLGYTPVFYGKSDPRHQLSGIIGLRQQIVFDIPPRPRILYMKLQYTPNYIGGNISWNPVTGTTNTFGMSVGISI
jgi:hypothetical protein